MKARNVRKLNKLQNNEVSLLIEGFKELTVKILCKIDLKQRVERPFKSYMMVTIS